MQAIQNLRQMFLFRLSAFGVMGLGIYVVFESNLPAVTTYVILAAAIASLVVVWLIIAPTYVCFDFVQSQIFIGTDKEDEQHFHLVIPMDELAGYVVKKEYGGLRKTLYLFRKHEQHYLRSKGTNISLLLPKQFKALEERFATIQRRNGTLGLKFT
jgi:hypothetical protein